MAWFHDWSIQQAKESIPTTCKLSCLMILVFRYVLQYNGLQTVLVTMQKFVSMSENLKIWHKIFRTDNIFISMVKCKSEVTVGYVLESCLFCVDLNILFQSNFRMLVACGIDCLASTIAIIGISVWMWLYDQKQMDWNLLLFIKWSTILMKIFCINFLWVFH